MVTCVAIYRGQAPKTTRNKVLICLMEKAKGKAIRATKDGEAITVPGWKNKLYFGDNMDILRAHVKDETIDLIYLDPPFNSNAIYNVLFQEKNGEDSAAQIGNN